MSYDTGQWLQVVAWFVAIVEFVLMLYVLLLNPRHLGNRSTAALFLALALNTLSIGLILDASSMRWIGLPLYVATTTAVVVGVLIVMTLLIKPDLLPKGRQWGLRSAWYLVYALAMLPIVLTLVDVLFGTRLWYTPPAGYAGGYVAIEETAAGVVSGIVRAPMTYVVGSLPILLLITVLIGERGLPTVTRQLAWLLLATQVVVLVLMGTLHGPMLTPLRGLLASALYAMTLAYATFRQMISERRAQVGRVQTRLTILLLVVVLPLFAGLMAVVLSRADGLIRAKSDEQLATANRSVAANTTTWLDLNVAALNELVMLPEIVGMDAERQKPILEAMAAAHPQMYLVSTTNPQGINVARNDAEAPKDYSDRLWYQGAVGGAPLTFQLLIGRTSGRPALVASVPIRAFGNGQESKIAGVGMFASELTDVAQQVQLSVVGDAGFSYVVDADNLVVAYPQQMPAGLGELSSSVPVTSLADLSGYPPVKALRAGRQGRLQFTDEAGQRWQAYVDEMEYGWGVIVQQPNDDFFSGLRGLQQIAFAFIAAGMLVLFGLTVLTVRQALLPVGGLTETATAIAGGDLLRVAPVESEDEFGVLGRAFNRMTGQLRELIGGLEERVTERTAELERRSAYLQASAEVGQAVGSILDVDALTTQVVNLIQERFGLYYVGLFLADPTGEWAVLRAGTGEVGQAMLARGHRVEVGHGMIGWSVAHGQARVALEAEADAVRLATPELPETRSEAALPLRSRGQVLGALTVQSAEAQAFDADAVSVLQTMADQVAVALDNARLFAESQQALEAARRAQGEVSRQAWSELVRTRPEWGYRYAGGRVLPIEVGGADGSGALTVDARGGGDGDEGAGRLDIPLQVRDQVIGVLGFRKRAPVAGALAEQEVTWTPEEVELLGTLVNRLEVALESARLYQDTQRRAAQERMVGEVTARMRESLDIETVLKTTASEIREALDLDNLVIRLASPETEGAQDRRAND